jgi:hypothetical protein
MGILKRLARFILRTELAVLQTKIKDLTKKYEVELSISSSLKEHFLNKTTPVDFIKVLEEKQIYIGDLQMLKNVSVRIKEYHKLNLDRYNKEFIPEFNQALCDDVDTKINAQLANEYNKMVLAKLESEIIALESIISKLEGII